MAYSRTVPIQLVAEGIGSAGRSIWSYQSADAPGDVDATDYFTDGVRDGMKVGDIVFVTNTSGYTVTVHAVSAVGAVYATISAAVLS